MNVFIDTEFSGLGSDPRLISIALVTENGEELYIELTSGWNAERCTRWVVEHVLPQLGSGEQLTRRAAAHRIDDWLTSLGTGTSLIVDSDWDADLLAYFFAENGIAADRRPVQILKLDNKAVADEFEVARQKFFRERGSQHHALTDARAFQFAWKACCPRATAPDVTAG